MRLGPNRDNNPFPAVDYDYNCDPTGLWCGEQSWGFSVSSSALTGGNNFEPRQTGSPIDTLNGQISFRQKKNETELTLWLYSLNQVHWPTKRHVTYVLPDGEKKTFHLERQVPFVFFCLLSYAPHSLDSVLFASWKLIAIATHLRCLVKRRVQLCNGHGTLCLLRPWRWQKKEIKSS